MRFLTEPEWAVLSPVVDESTGLHCIRRGKGFRKVHLVLRRLDRLKLIERIGGDEYYQYWCPTDLGRELVRRRREAEVVVQFTQSLTMDGIMATMFPPLET